ncbi:hypothetical protein KC319_g21 [Hortaea werneckii]|nr:hypothetical protein KC319_g21 [Hortaea werneckii]
MTKPCGCWIKPAFNWLLPSTCPSNPFYSGRRPHIVDGDDDADYQMAESQTDSMSDILEDDEDVMYFDNAPREIAAAESGDNTTMRNGKTRRPVDGTAGPAVPVNGQAIPTRPHQALDEDDDPRLDVGAYQPHGHGSTKLTSTWASRASQWPSVYYWQQGLIFTCFSTCIWLQSSFAKTV